MGQLPRFIQFIRNEPIAINELVNKLIDNYADYADNKGITLNRLGEKGPIVSMNRQLAFILFTNLIKNAIRHGRMNSSVLLEVNANSFIISNEGEPLPFPKEEIFNRFVRNQTMPYSTGLGLAIVKEIANQYEISIQYKYASLVRRHVFELSFP